MIFIQQVDYVLFIHGLSFISLGWVSFTLLRENDRRLPWLWFGLFGLTQGAGQWLRLVAFSLSDETYLAALSVALCTLPFLFLIEFGRVAASRFMSKSPGPWIYLPVLAVILLSSSLGLERLEICSGGALCVLGGLWAAAVLYIVSRQLHGIARLPLQCGSVSIVLYSLIASGLAVYSTCVSATIVRDFSYQGAFGFSGEVVKTLLAMSMPVALHRYYMVSGSNADEQAIRMRVGAIGTVAITLILMGGWAMTMAVGISTDKQFRSNLVSRTSAAAAAIDPTDVTTLQGSPSDILNPYFQQLNNTLRAIKKGNIYSRYVYLMGMKEGGVVLLACAEPASSTDYSAPGDPYPEATVELKSVFSKGEPITEGPESDSWGTWVSGIAPIRNPSTGQIIAVLGIDLDASIWIRAVALSRLFCIVITFLVSILTIAFLSILVTIKLSAARVSASETRYRSLVEGSPNTVALFDVEGRYVTINQPGLRIMGREEKEVIGKEYSSIWPAEIRPLIRNTLRQVLAGAQCSFEAEFMRPDGRSVFWHVVLNPVVCEEDGVIGFTGISVDTTRRKEAEDKLRASEARYRLLADNLTDVIWTADMDLRFTYFSPSMTNLTGYIPEEACSLSLDDLLTPASFETAQKSLEEAMLLEHLDDDKRLEPVCVELEIRRKDGSIVWTEVRTAFLRDEDNRPYGIIGVARDITYRRQTEEALRASEENYRAIFDSANDAIIVHDLRTGCIIDANQRMCEMFGYTLEEAKNRTIGSLISGEPPYTQTDLRKLLGKAARGKPQLFEWKALHKEGHALWVEINLKRTSINDEDRILAIIRDVARRKQAETNMQIQASAINAAGDQIVIVDAAGNIVFVNPAFEKEMGYSFSEVQGKPPSLLNSGEHDKAFYDQIWSSILAGQTWHGEIVHRRKDGNLCTEDMTVTPVKNEAGVIEHFVAIKRNITDKMDYQRQLDHLAHHDPLTGLPNRLLFSDRLAQALARARAHNNKLSVMFLDIDRFKLINDTLGHSVGDILLKKVAERLVWSLREVDTIARMGGDEFTVILAQPNCAEDVANLARRILDALSQPIRLDSGEVFVTASIGISTFPADGESAEDLVKKADMAMYRAKEQGRDTFYFYTDSLTNSTMKRMALENSLRKALEREELIVHYQPRVDIRTGKVLAAEALVRWQHPEHGLITANQFVPMAEETGLIVSIGDWVMRTACAQVREWSDMGLPAVDMAVNISAHQFKWKDLRTTVSKILSDTGLDPRQLDLELTESTLMHDPEVATEILRGLKDMGLKISIDDFGTGYSSLSYLKMFPVNAVKIDRSFIHQVTTSSDDAAIARAIVGMAHSLKLKVVAEGVETLEQLEFLRSIECDEIQGYFISRPVPSDEFAQLLRNGSRGQQDILWAA